MVYIYILELESGKYYVGKSNSPEIRIADHQYGMGSKFTLLYKPIRLIEIISDCDDYDEDKYTLQYMDKYGILNVRGGSFSEIQFSKTNLMMINRMINGAKNQCFLCGSKEHFVKHCDKRDELKENDGKCDCTTSLFSPHRKSKCALKKMIDFFDIFTNIEEEDDDNTSYYEEVQKQNPNQKRKSTKIRGCYRCGREGHYATNCYAKRSVYGKIIKN